MQIHIRFIAFALATACSSYAYGDSNNISIFFVNKTGADFTIKPSAANFCIDSYDTNSFTVAAGDERTYYATLHQNCTNANLTFDYSQTFDRGSVETARTINGTITYGQFTQNGKWMAKLDIELTPPVPRPKPVIFRTACDEKFVFCSTAAVPLTSNNFYARFTAIPVGAAVSNEREFMHIGK